MGTTAQKLQKVLKSKNAIKTALANKGKNPTDVFSTYASIINNMADLTPEIQTYGISTDKVPRQILVSATDGSRIVVLTDYEDIGAYSDDNGLTWTTYAIGYGFAYEDLIYADGIFICVSDNQSEFLHSTDGLTWQATDTGITASWRSIAYGNGAFVAVAADSKTAGYSTDGTNWIEKTLPSDAPWSAVEWCNDRFVAVSNGSNAAAWSYDGTVWYSFLLPGVDAWCDIACGNGRTLIIAGGKDGTKSNAMVWTTSNNTFNLGDIDTGEYEYNFRDIAYSNGVWIITTNTGHILYSYNGSTWKMYNHTQVLGLNDIVYLNGYFVLLPYATTLQSAAIIKTKLPPSTAKYLGTATPEEIPCGITFTSIHGFGMIGQKIVDDAETYLLVNGDESQATLALLASEETVNPTATSNDIRIGTTAITSTGYTEGTKDIPTYHTETGMMIIPSGKTVSFVVETYDYTKVHATLSTFNNSISESVAVIASTVYDSVYEAGTTNKLADITKDDSTQSINLGITAESMSVLRYFVMKEEK